MTGFNGNIVGEQRYYPFGETRLSTGTMVTDKLFTGQRAMEDLGIYHYGARFYSPGLGRFLSADTIIPGYANPQNLNRYSYVGNSPLNYTDPTGHMRIQDGPQQDTFKPSVYNKYVPKPKPKPKPNKPFKQNNNSGRGNNKGDDTVTSSIPTTLPTPDPDVTPVTTTTPSSTDTVPPFTQNSQVNVGEPDWGKIGEGVAIILVVDLLVVTPIVVGLVVFAPELEIAMVLTEAWSWPLVVAVVAANVYGFNLIREGITGESKP